jgi:phosphoribosylamine--glycine ligase
VWRTVGAMKVLLIGNGGREHALAWKLVQSPRLTELLVAPGNPGTALWGRNVPVRADDVPGLVHLAATEGIDLVVVGPEVPLAAGLADALDRAGIACFGPTQAAATIESSKAFAKTLMREIGVPVGGYEVFGSASAALHFLDEQDWTAWRVVKANGLRAGKGVVVAESEAELRAAIGQLATSDEPLVLEEPLEGDEISLLAFSDGKTIAPMVPAQDHKRLQDGDRGPNTGGMGAYAPVAAAPAAADLGRQVIAPVIATLAARGTSFVGVLYAGLMLTSSGPRVIEYNARWGDPEAQALLPLFDADLLDIMIDCVAGRLHPETVRFGSGATLGVVLAAANYPGTPRQGDPIALPPARADVHVFHAGTTLDNGTLVTAGGRVLTVVGTGASLEQARDSAYACAEEIQFAGKQMRHDIGWRSLKAGARSV